MALLFASLTIPAASAVNAAAAGAATRQIAAAGERACVPLVYGSDRLGGLVLNVLPAGATSSVVLVQVLWCFACNSINDLRFNDQALPSGLTATHYTGSQTSTDSALVAAFAAQGITYTETLNGYAYSVFSLPSGLFDGQLNFSARIEGRKLYDPRLDSTAGGSGSHRLADATTWTYSDNGALAEADFLSSTVYGCAATVDWTSVPAAANACDAMIGSPAEKRRIVGVSFVSAAAAADIAEALRVYAGCWLLPGASGIRLVPDADASSVATYAHASGQIASIEALTLRDLGNSPTAVEIIYTDTSRIPYRDSSAVATLSGAGTTLPWRLSTVRLPGVQRYSQAYREAVERLNKLTLQDLSTTIEVFDDGIRHELADIITVTHPIGLTSKKLRISDPPELISPGRWRLPVVEHDPAVYSTAVATLSLPGDTARRIGVARRFRAVSRGYSDTGAPVSARLADGDSGAVLGTPARSYFMARISLATGNVDFSRSYDVHGVGATGGGYTAANLAADLNGSGSDVVVVVIGFDEPATNRLTSNLPAAMYRCGASRVIFGSPQFKLNSAYLLVGVPGCGEGNGYEAYQGDVDGSTNAWCDVDFGIVNGALEVYSTAFTPRTLKDYGYTGSLAATTGEVLNRDRYCAIPQAWEVTGAVFRADVTDAVGQTALGNVVGGFCLVKEQDATMLDRNRRYRLAVACKATAGTPTVYLGVAWTDQTGAEIVNPGPSGWSNGTYSYFGLTGTSPSGSMTNYSIEFGTGAGAAAIPATAYGIKVMAYLNYATTSGAQAVISNVRLQDITDIFNTAAAAAAAQSTANTAATDATSALSTLATMRSNGYIDAAEKPALMDRWASVVAEYTPNVDRATEYGITTEKTAYTAAYNALSSYLSGLSPAWNNTTTDTPITPATDAAKWTDYYSTRSTLLNRIATVAKALADAAQGTANTAVTNAAAAQATANTAASNATSALSTLATMRSNGYLDAAEKPAVIREWNAIVGEASGINAQAALYGVSNSAYSAAYNALSSYLNSLSPSWSDTTQDSPITPAVDQAKWLDFYNARQALLQAIADETAKRAVWATVTGTGRPSDNATRDIAFVNTGGAVSVQGNTLTKSATGNTDSSWDSAVNSVESYTGGAYVTFSPAQNNLPFMIGLNTAGDLGDSGYATIDWALYCEYNRLYAYESGTPTLISSAYAAGDALAVIYSEGKVRYQQNGTVLREVAATITAPLFMDSAFYSRSARADRVVFGPMTSATNIATAQLAANAATKVNTDSADLGGASYGTTTVRSWVFTPTFDCTIEFNARVEANNLVNDSGKYVTWYVTPAGGSAVLLGGSSANSTARQEATCVAAFAATGGVALTFELRSSNGGSAPNLNIWNTYMRATEVRR